MSMSLDRCAALLVEEGLRHSVDDDDGVIRVLFSTSSYRNPRGEHVAIVTVDVPDEGRRLRAAIRHAFSPRLRGRAEPDDDSLAAELCLTSCRLAADTPLVGAEYDADERELRLVAEMPTEDGDPTRRQLVALVDRLVEAAERWQLAFDWSHARRSKTPRRNDAA